MDKKRSALSCFFMYFLRFLFIVCFPGLVFLLLPGGCSREYYKQQADEESYEIIDNKWDAEHGRKVNYRISDVEKDANSIDVSSIDTGGFLTLEEAVSIATAQSREYQQQKEALFLSALDLTLFRHDFAMQWFGTFDSDYVRNSSDESLDYSAELGFAQLLADGTQISTSVALDWIRFLTGDPSESLSSLLSATVSKPLLRGSGRKVVQENLTQAERNVLYQIRLFNRFRKTFVVSVVGEYYQVLQSLDSVQNSRSNYENLVFAYERAKMMAESGRLPQFQADQTQQSMLSARDQLTRAVQSYERDLDRFKLSLAIPVDMEVRLDPNELGALSDVSISDLEYSSDDAIEAALVNRLDLAVSADRVDDARRKVYVAADALNMDLDLVGSLGVDSTDKKEFTRLRFHEGSYSVGGRVSLPLDRKSERNAYRESLISLNRRQRAFDEFIDEVKLEVRDAYRRVEESARRYEIQVISLNLARERVASTNLLLEAGRAETRDLLEAQESLLSAQNSTTSRLVDYTLARLAFYRDIGLLNVRPDGMWEL